MTKIGTVFFDVGGVLLTNAWDHAERARASAKFGLDAAAFEARHAPLAHALERGQLSLDEYLDRAVFDQPRSFSRADFRAFMESCSAPLPESLALLERLAQNRDLHLATLNNEGRELNAYRIAKFDLGRYFDAFFSSCYLDARKPDAPIYQRALGILQCPPGAALFVDDREENLVPARALGLNCIRFQSAAQLAADLATFALLPQNGSA